MNRIKGKPALVRLAVVVCAALSASACSSIADGTSQQLAIGTTPTGADCELTRNGLVIARVNPTPGLITVDKTKYDILVKCRKEGFHEASYFNESDVAGATFGNIILGGGIGWAIDSASGADNKYHTPVEVLLTPLDQPDPGMQYPPKPKNEEAAEK